VACAALCLLALDQSPGGAVVSTGLASGWGVRGVAEMASHVQAGGWNLGGDSVDQDTGYLHMFSSPHLLQAKKKVVQADDTDCLEHDCTGASADAMQRQEEEQEKEEEEEEEKQIQRQARRMKRFAMLGARPSKQIGLRASPMLAAPRARHSVRNMRRRPQSMEHAYLPAQRKQQWVLEAMRMLSKIGSAKRPSVQMSSMKVSPRRLIRKLDRIAPLPNMQDVVSMGRARANRMHDHAHESRVQSPSGIEVHVRDARARVRVCGSRLKCVVMRPVHVRAHPSTPKHEAHACVYALSSSAARIARA
jgi:hypothetical protein